MYKVLIENEVYLKIDNFIESYTNSFLKRFNDTGIFDEYLIVEHYKKISYELNKDIYNGISTKLGSENIFSNKVLKNLNLECVIFAGNYMILLEYKEEKSKTRIVKDIFFHKK